MGVKSNNAAPAISNATDDTNAVDDDNMIWGKKGINHHEMANEK